MPISDISIEDVNGKSAEELRGLINETPDFPKPSGGTETLLKEELVAMIVDYLGRDQGAVEMATEAAPEEIKDPEAYESEILLQLKAMGFHTKDDAMSMLKAIYKEKAILDHKGKELAEKALSLDKRELDINALTKWMEGKKKELEAIVLEKKKLITVIEQARAQGVKF